MEDPFTYKMYDGIRAQMDGSTQRTVTNNPNLLKNIHWYTKTFQLKHLTKGATLDSVIVPQAEWYLQVPTIQSGKVIEVEYYYSPEFTSTLLSDNDVLESSRHHKEYYGQSMLKFF